MAKQLTFKIGSKDFSLEPIKVDRRKIYGWSDLVVTNQVGSLCATALLNDDGMTIAPAGSTKPGMLSDSGLWVSRDELIAVDATGNKVSAASSSFEMEITLDTPISLDDFLSMNIDSVYQLCGDDAEEFAKAIGRDIYSFNFSYRGGYQYSDACIIADGEHLFVLIGTKVQFPFIGIEQQGVIDEDPAEEEITEDIDFSMF